MNSELQKILDLYVLDQNNPQLNYKLAEEYYKSGNQSAACSYYIKAAELTNDRSLKTECFLKMGYSYLKQGDRLREAKLMAEYARANSPIDPRSYIISCLVNMKDKDWLSLLNMSETACNLPISSTKYDEFYTDNQLPRLYHAYALMNMRLFEEGQRDCYEVYNNSFNQSLKIQAVQLLDDCGFTPEFNSYDGSKKSTLRAPFDNLELVKENHSQALQDIFVLTATNGKKGGLYLEIGSAHPIIHSNTKLLEDFDWKGLSIELNGDQVNEFKSKRKNDCLQADATSLDYNLIFSKVFQANFIDYLQVDIDPASATLEVLTKIINTGQKFGVITFEHDVYKPGNEEVRMKERELLSSNGYQLIVPNVSIIEGLPFEDWWIHKDYPKSDQLNKLNISSIHNTIHTTFFI